MKACYCYAAIEERWTGRVFSIKLSSGFKSSIPSKVLERIVNSQLIGYLNEFHLFPDVQSSYRRCHSTETAVFKVFSDIVDAMANGEIALLSLLDIAMAFDSVDHDILLRRLEVTYGFNGAVRQCLRSYVEDRMQSIHSNGSISRPRRVICGVPQGSVLGHLLFTLCTADIGIIVHSFGLKHHTYADDNKIYSSHFPAECASFKIKVIDCIDVVDKCGYPID